MVEKCWKLKIFTTGGTDAGSQTSVFRSTVIDFRWEKYFTLKYYSNVLIYIYVNVNTDCNS